MVLTLILILFIGTLLMSQLYQASRNETTIENLLRSEEITKMNQKGSVLENFKDYFDDKPYLNKFVLSLT